MNVQNILAEINKTGVARASHFEVFISGPGRSRNVEPGTNTQNNTERALVARASAAELPGRTLATAEHRFHNYGPINKVPYGQIYSDMTIDFLMSEDLREKKYFELWQNKMVHTDAFGKNTNANSRFNVGYFQNYATNIEVRTYGPAGDIRSIHTLQEAYPIIVNPVTLNYESEELMKLSVTFAYRNYRAVYYEQDQPGLGFGFSARLSRRGIDFGGRIPSLGNIVGSTDLGAIQATVDGVSNVFARIRNF